jgi:hypothetical protein
MTLSTDCLGALLLACWGALFGFESAAVYPRRPGHASPRAWGGGGCRRLQVMSQEKEQEVVVLAGAHVRKEARLQLRFTPAPALCS